MYNQQIPEDGVMKLAGQQDFPRPAVVDRYMARLQAFARLIASASVATTASLSQSLQIPESDNLTTCLAEEERGGTLGSPAACY